MTCHVPISYLLSPISYLLSPISYLLSPISYLLSPKQTSRFAALLPLLRIRRMSPRPPTDPASRSSRRHLRLSPRAWRISTRLVFWSPARKASPPRQGRRAESRAGPDPSHCA